MDRKYNKYKDIIIFEPKGYHYHKRSNKWRHVYDDNGVKKYKLFKTEDEVKNFIKNKIKNYESFTSKMVG